MIPNVVCEEFNGSFLKEHSATNTFFMVSGWKWPKRPDIVIDAFAAFLEDSGKEYFLRIGGYGSLLPEMKKQVAQLGLTARVSFLGSLDSTEIAKEMKFADAFLHCSDFETFSVVCAEALCAGCPVVASAVGGIVELLEPKNGVLVQKNEVQEWKAALQDMSDVKFCRREIAEKAGQQFSFLRVGKKYYNTLLKVANGS